MYYFYHSKIANNLSDDGVFLASTLVLLRVHIGKTQVPHLKEIRLENIQRRAPLTLQADLIS